MASSARIDELLKKFEENPRRYFAPLANEYRKAGDVERAIQLCREHLPQQPGHMSGHIVFGQALFEAHQFDEARQVFTAALALDPENLIALRHLGDIARGEGDLGAARDWYQRVLDADPRNDEIGTLLASLDAGEVATTGAEQGGPRGEPTLEVPPPLDLSSGAFATVGGAEPPPAAPGERAASEPPAPSTAPEPPVTISAMDFALASIPSAAPPARDTARDTAPAAPADAGAAHGDSEFDIAYVTGGVAGSDEMELTPAHGASALVSRADEPEDASSFDFGEVLGDGDRSPLELADEQPAAAASEAPPSAPIAVASAPAAPASAPAPAAMDDRPLGLESMEFVPPSRDAQPDPMQGHLLREEEPAAGTPAAFVTETMAELYLQQGFRDEALSVYRQLLAQSPADENLRDRVAQLESGSVSSVGVAGISDTVIEAARQRQSAPAPKKTAREFFAALASWRPAPPANRMEGGPEAPFASHHAADDDEASAELQSSDERDTRGGAASGAGETAVDEFGFPVDFDSSRSVVHRDLGAPRVEEERRGLDLGAALIGDDAALDEADALPATAAIEPATLDFAADEQGAAGATDSGEGLSMAGFDVVSAEEMTGDRYGQTDREDDESAAGPAADFAPPPGVGRLSGPVDTLFGDSAVPGRDEAAASALASAFGGDVSAADEGPAASQQPAATPGGGVRQSTDEVRRTTGAHSASSAARPAGSELSLDHVFRETPRRGTEKRREAPAFSFDQFFSDSASARAAEAPSAPTPGEGTQSHGDAGADIEQFNAWLEGLKRK